MQLTLALINQMQADGVIGKYAIGGAVGATLYLEPSATLDVDIFVMMPKASESGLISLSAIYDYLGKRGGKAEGEHMVIGGWPVQFLAPATKLEQEALQEAIETEVQTERTYVMTAEHLAAIALQTGRPKDFARILQFLEHHAVNMEELMRIVKRHGLEGKWEKFKERFLNE